MKKASQTSRNGFLEFYFRYELDDADPRPQQYGPGMYRPDLLMFRVRSAADMEKGLPRYKDLRLESVSMAGPKLKKDGKHGAMRASESFFGSHKQPEWVNEIIHRAITDLKADAVDHVVIEGQRA